MKQMNLHLEKCKKQKFLSIFGLKSGHKHILTLLDVTHKKNSYKLKLDFALWFIIKKAKVLNLNKKKEHSSCRGLAI